ncbi:MAG TPA: hypothetical protein VJV78_09930 [Polyangiales bacterium]|nr:hypothetical protein [Polyangiales bacterium]
MQKKYVPNLASLDASFPELLRTFAAWLSDQPRSSLGYFHLESTPLDAVYAGSDAAAEKLRERLRIFMILPDHSRLALWQLPNRPPAIVLLPKKGDPKPVAPDLETLLLQLASGKTAVPQLGNDDADFDQVRKTLDTWLAARGISFSNVPEPVPDLLSWFHHTQREAELTLQSRPPLQAATLPPDLTARADHLLGRLVDDPEVLAFFASLGIDLPALPGPKELRDITRPSEGVSFEIAWPWDLPSEWLELEYPKSLRAELERRRARMFWAVRFFATHEDRPQFRRYTGALPLDLSIEDDASTLEQKLGPPIRGSMGSRLWDFPALRRSLTVSLNEGVFAKPERPLGALNSLRWGFSQSR